MDRPAVTCDQGSAPPTAGLAVDAVSEDAFLGGAVRLLQPGKGYRAGIDAVLLAAVAEVGTGAGARVLDAGAGVGAVGLCVAARARDASVVLVERDPVLAELAARNVAGNGFSARVSVVVGDVADPGLVAAPGGAVLREASFTHVLANPPFHDAATGTRAPLPRKAASHAMAAGDLDGWARFLARMAAAGGTAIVIHKAEALGELLTALGGRFGGLKVLPVQARPGAPAIRVIVAGVKGSRAPLSLLAPFALHGATGSAFTVEADAILRHGARLALER